MNIALYHTIPKTDELQLEINISTTLSISAEQAKRRVTRYLMDNISMFIHPNDPFLVIMDKQQIYWRFPVILSMGQQGRLGQVGELDVDAHTGQLIISEDIIGEITTNAERLANSSSLAAVK